MKNDLFEKQISEKLNQCQVSPSRDLFDDIMKARTPQVKKAFWSTWRILSAFLIAATVSVAVYQLLPTQTDEIAFSEKSIVSDKENQASAEESKISNSTSEQGNKNEILGAISKKQNRKSVNTAFKSSPNEAAKVNNSENNASNTLSEGDVFESYFNANVINRPVIDYEKHNGNSHLYAFVTENEKDIDKVMVNHMKNKLFVRFTNHFPELYFNKIEQQKVEKANRVSQKPFYIDVFQLSSFSKPVISNSQFQLHNMGVLATNSASFGWGVNAELPIKGRWSVFSGVHSFSLNNQYKGQLNYSVDEDKITKITRFINDPIKGVIAIESFDTSLVSVAKSRNIELQNSYQLIQIPLGMSYNFGYKSFEFSLNASAMLNWSREQSFQSVNWQNDQVSKMETSNNLFGLGLNAGLKVYYPLSNRFKVFVMPGVQSYSMNGVKSSYSHNESVLAKQVQVGIRYSVF
jgi:hypothetical protein